MKKILLLTTLFLLAVVSTSFAQDKNFYAQGPAGSKKIALTFDDGPGEITKDVLQILKDKNVHATFFELGICAATYPDLVRAIKEGGHEIGNHTYNHINFYSYKKADKSAKIEEELLRSEKVITSITGTKPVLVRYPYGYMHQDALDVAKKHGYTVINWSFGYDWTKGITAEQLHQKYKAAIKDGAIFLMHDGSKNKRITEFLGQFIDEIRAQGYELVTVSELLNLKQTEAK